MIEYIKKQFETNETSCGSPQAWLYLKSERSIEIVLEQEGLEEKDYFYSIRLHCSEEEFDNDDFKSTCGVIEMYCTDKADEKEMVELVEKILKGFNETLVI